MKDIPLLKVDNLKMHFPIYGGIFYRKIGSVYAVNGVSFKIKRGETVGLVGESGCGKSTVGRCIIKLYEPTSGDITFDGLDIASIKGKHFKSIRRQMQMIFQDPFESLNSRHSITEILEEPFIIHMNLSAKERRKKVLELIDQVGLSKNDLSKYPHAFSGGQRQRIGIARAISLKPKLIICDEPVSALDVSIQSQVLNLLLSLQKEMNLSYLFIAHDLSVVKHMSDKIAVMYLGRIVEFSSSEDLYKSPLHPYTKALIASIPTPDPSKRSTKKPLIGEVPSVTSPPKGCYFHPRCPYAKSECFEIQPQLKGTEGHKVACHLYDNPKIKVSI